MSARTSVFVYGTLKRGGSNYSWLAGQHFAGTARTAPGFRLYSLGSYPGMVADPTDTAGVEGELWLVDGDCLRRLDELEGVDEGLYRREPIALAEPPGHPRVETYLYARTLAGARPLGSNWAV
jgi:gamma-glutamylcyclotransferase (GGCT)/AIG2-like uncharacterized protein YtfP